MIDDVMQANQVPLVEQLRSVPANAHLAVNTPNPLGHEKGVVKLLFPKPVAWIGFTPEQAIDLAQDLIKHARQCGFAGVYTIQIGQP